MRVPVLTYHSNNIAGNDYTGNDHVAFAADLRLIDDLGLRIVPLQHVVDRLLGRHADDLHRCVALTCDDGTDFDHVDIDHPTDGLQRSLFNCLRDFRSLRGDEAQPDLHLTSFVISDPGARELMDKACMVGRGWMNEAWWREVDSSGLMAIENHSWDHNHPCLPTPGPLGLVRGDFFAIKTEAQAEFEITQAQDYLQARLGRRPRLFCYPFGHISEYLYKDWLPTRGPQVGLDAAFGDGATPVTESGDRWNLPRYICGWHWKTPDELRAILEA
ncbi:MAG TPA: polysaccharide deacetylase family protein [Rudaea sp.]|jgi:peptidoglycan/xylan/chitin deacetylase (PgdA/CDA1 family)|nr:polysaccharide deacetylase family protein [Rudaea sp.]